MEHDGWALPEKADRMWHYFERHADGYRSLCGKWTLELPVTVYIGMDQDTHNCVNCQGLKARLAGVSK